MVLGELEVLLHRGERRVGIGHIEVFEY